MFVMTVMQGRNGMQSALYKAGVLAGSVMNCVFGAMKGLTFDA